MVDQTVMLKVEAATQAAQLPSLTGKSFTVAKTVTAGDGLSKWLVLMPQGGGKAAADGMVVLKVEGGKNVLGSLVGQTFTVGKAPIIGQGAGKWLVLQPQAAKGAVGVKALLSGSGFAGSGTTGQAATAQLVNGVIAPPVDPTLALALKGMEVEAPEMAAAAVKGAAAKGAASKGAMVVAKGGGAMVQGGNAAGVGAAAGVATKSAASGTIWSGTGTSLGLGLGLGAWGPVILVGALAAVGVGVYSYLKNRDAGDGTSELHEAVS